MRTRRMWRALTVIALICVQGCKRKEDANLHKAIENGDLQLAAQAIRQGADCEALNSKGLRPLVAAVLWHNPAMVKLLLEAGANVNANDDAGWTALMWGQEIESVKLLVGAGADVKARNDDGETALMFAKTPAIAELLLASGSDVFITDHEGKTAIARIVDSENPFAPEIAEVLREAEDRGKSG